VNTTWHADPDVLSRYAAETLDDVRAASLEAHLLTCERCREALVPLTANADLDDIWRGIETALDAPRPGIVEWLLLHVGVGDDVARLLAATTSLRLSWLLAEAFALGTAALAAHAAAGTVRATATLFVFLALAALVPVVGVAAAFGPGVDPSYEIGIAAPMRSDRLLFIRAAAVLGASLAIAGIAALVLPGTGWTLALWLAPALGLSLATLALATVLRPISAALTVGLAWVVLAAVTAATSADPMTVFRAGGQLLFLGLTASSSLVIACRHAAYEGRIPA
jgi:putative zinc finger protein